MPTEREVKAALRKLTKTIAEFTVALDKEMEKPPSYDRGKRIAKLTNLLTLENQSAMHSILGYSFPKIHKMYGVKNERSRQS